MNLSIKYYWFRPSPRYAAAVQRSQISDSASEANSDERCPTTLCSLSVQQCSPTVVNSVTGTRISLFDTACYSGLAWKCGRLARLPSSAICYFLHTSRPFPLFHDVNVSINLLTFNPALHLHCVSLPPSPSPFPAEVHFKLRIRYR
ncbi:hypothetical protein ARMGADRAFT_573316 [Armillaria gallica]|uniref:Uncharacterized protein n=1 Tax=Armillaria gallica TaxID=47427 RepID=A0A2H3ECW3_ARMGA|nr:hypothetical protein ARMGADRAFT_573316 [Armillaria gallica]